MSRHAELPETITVRRPDDWHVHLRDGAILRAVLPYTARVFGRAVIMPNLLPPVDSVAAVRAYRERILRALPDGSGFTPLMSCYLTLDLKPKEVERGHASGDFFAVKMYPAGATTNAQFGIAAIEGIYPVLETMQRIGMPLLIHGEAIDPSVDIFDREAVFIEQTLKPLLERFPALKVVMEHITTADAVDFIAGSNDSRLGATITPHHLMINRNAIFRNGIRPHYYCLPIAKREKHRQALRRAAVSGMACFFPGSDTAPHLSSAKESACGCAGIFNAPNAVECYAQVFAEENALDNFETFMSLNGPGFHGLAPNETTLTLRRQSTRVPETIGVDGGTLVPFLAGESLGWSLEAGRPTQDNPMHAATKYS